MAFPIKVLEVYDCGRVDGADGSEDAGCEIVAAARTGEGVYTLTLPAPGIPAANCLISVDVSGTGVAGASGAAKTVVHTSDTVKTITTSDVAGAALDCVSFDFKIEIIKGAAQAQDNNPGLTTR